MSAPIKDWLGFELDRNKKHAQLYCEIMQRAFGSSVGKGSNCGVLIGHHCTFELDGDLQTENEIPSADCLMFDHDIMHAVFGEDAVGIMVKLAMVPVDQRDEMLAGFLLQLKEVEAASAAIPA